MDKYLEKHQQYDLQIDNKAETDLNLCIVIPCFNETEIISSLESLKNCTKPEKSTEVIIVVNSSEETEKNIILRNRTSLQEIKEWSKLNSTKKLKFYSFNVENMPKKFAGVGLARKIGMDEAYARLISVNNPKGVIAGFDSDSLCAKNYLIEIEKHFKKNKKSNAISIHFEHPISGTKFSEEIYQNITLYELYLRYYKQALEYANFPYAFHTIGSSFALRAEIYAKQGGMNRKKAGEDFYFLQKIIPLGNFHELKTTTVYPSPRPSDRVPFGTGAAIQKMLDKNNNSFLTYHIQAFIDLKHFFSKKENLFQINSESLFQLMEENEVSGIIVEYLKMNNFIDELKKINQNSPNLEIFNSRFFQWFNAFRVLKFLNFSHEEYYEKERIEIQAANLIQITQEIPTCSFLPTDLLSILRRKDLT